MKTLCFVSFIIFAQQSFSQHIENLPARGVNGEMESVYVEKLADDSLATAFEIWIRGGVKHHFHATHTECIYILEGEGRMDWGETSFTVKVGDFVMIPKGTVHAVTATIPMKVLSIQTPQWVTEDRTFVEPIRRPHNE